MEPAIHHQIVAAGVEEEFHIVDLATRRLTAQADRPMERLPAGGFSSELQRSVLEANSRPWVSLANLAGDIARGGRPPSRPPGPSGWASWPQARSGTGDASSLQPRSCLRTIYRFPPGIAGHGHSP